MEKNFKTKFHNFFKNFLLFILVISFSDNSISSNLFNVIDNLNVDNKTANNTHELENLYKNILDGITTFVNDNILQNNTFNETTCYNYLKNIDNETHQNNIKIMIQYTNFKLTTEVTDEIECKRNGLNYYLISYKLKSSANMNENFMKILEFLNYSVTFNSGICLIDECKNILEDNFIKTNEKNYDYHLSNTTKLFNYLNDSIDINATSLFKTEDGNIDNDDRYSKTYPVFISIIIIFGVILIIRIILIAFSYRKLNKLIEESQNKEKNENKENKDNKSENSENSEDLFLFTKKYQNIAKEIKNDSLNEEKYINFHKVISFIQNISDLGKNKNNFYDNTNLEIPYGIQTIVLFFVSLVYTFYNYVFYPSTNYFNNNIFSSYEISLLKFAQYSSYFYLSLNGFIYSFKFMCYYKEYVHYKIDKTILRVLIYFITFIPKMIMFALSSFVFHSFSLNILNLISNYSYQNEFKERIKPKDCLDKIHFHLLFIYPYIIEDKKDGFVQCYNYIYSFINEFYCVIFFILIFCLCTKLRSKIFEVVIIIIVSLNLICNFIFFMFRSEFEIGKTNYDYTAFLGEKLSIKYFHIYFNIFLYGAFAGIIHFYNIDILKTNRVNKDDDDYFPFSFLGNISNFLSNFNSIKRLPLFIINLIILALLSSVFFIENKVKEGDKLILDRFLNFIHIYENHISTIIFMIVVLLLCTMDKNSPIKLFFNSYPFIFISRIGYFFYSICETTILIYFIVTNYQTYMNLNDILFFNFGQFICGILISTIFVILIEIPVRYFSKILRKRIENSEYFGGEKVIKDEVEKEEKLELKSLDGSYLDKLNSNVINDSNLSEN